MDGPAPAADGLRPMYYAELQEIFGRMPFGLRNYWSGRFLRELPDELLELSAAHFEPEGVRGSVLLEPLYGAAKRVPPEATAFAGREANYNATFISYWTDPAARRPTAATPGRSCPAPASTSFAPASTTGASRRSTRRSPPSGPAWTPRACTACTAGPVSATRGICRPRQAPRRNSY